MVKKNDVEEDIIYFGEQPYSGEILCLITSSVCSPGKWHHRMTVVVFGELGVRVSGCKPWTPS